MYTFLFSKDGLIDKNVMSQQNTHKTLRADGQHSKCWDVVPLCVLFGFFFFYFFFTAAQAQISSL